MIRYHKVFFTQQLLYCSRPLEENFNYLLFSVPALDKIGIESTVSSDIVRRPKGITRLIPPFKILLNNAKTKWDIFSNFCGLLRLSELYVNNQTNKVILQDSL